MRLTSVRLLVDDFPACHAFYAGLLGLTPRFGDGDGPYEEFDDGTGGAAHIAMFKRGMMAEAIDGMSKRGPSTCGDPVVLTLEVDDVDQVARDLTDKGVTFVAEPKDQPAWRLRVAHLRDPSGNLIEINAPLRT